MSQGSRQEIKTQAIILATFVAIFWLLEILDQFVFRVSGQFRHFRDYSASSHRIAGYSFRTFPTR